MFMAKRLPLLVASVLFAAPVAAADGTAARTFCNPMDLDYAFARRPRATEKYEPHRSTADPVCVPYKGKYYLFATNQEGYWYSSDLKDWRFVAHKFAVNDCGDQVCAPGAWPTDKGLLFLPCFVAKDKMPLYVSTEPDKGIWSEANPAFAPATWDPSIFQDDDKRVYLYWGSSNLYPLYGVELDPADSYKPLGKPLELLHLHPDQHGWERFGEDNQNGKMDPFIEGAWVNKFNGRYYLQYGAPGTEFNIYGDGVYVSDKPLGPFTYQKHNPFSWKPTGFIRGAGHGSTFADKVGNLWHVATMDISVKDTFERRIGLFPTALDKDGTLYTDTAFGDYPQYIPQAKVDYNDKKSRVDYYNFTGWMLLSYMKPVKADLSLPGHDAAMAADENIKTYWSAPDGKAGHWLKMDLGKDCTIKAIQINFADEKAELFGKQNDISQQYEILCSSDGKNWHRLVDRTKSKVDSPHCYIELNKPARARFLQIVSGKAATGCFALQDLRVFGKAPGAVPAVPTELKVCRSAHDKRDVELSWQTVDGAYAYSIDFGVAPDKLYSSLLVYGASTNNYSLHSLNLYTPYFFRIRAVGESGLSLPGPVVADGEKVQ
jgi:xylan 1,4-beta-xylosidase